MRSEDTYWFSWLALVCRLLLESGGLQELRVDVIVRLSDHRRFSLRSYHLCFLLDQLRAEVLDQQQLLLDHHDELLF